MIDIKNPKNIYESLSSSILSITDKLKIKTDDEKFEVSKIEVLNLIDTFRQEKLDKAIEDLKNSQEWEKFTVAFYGETNAGKSTIIESLRIYFQEEEKIKQQIEFEKNGKEYDKNKKTLESKIESIKNDILENKSNKEQLALDFEAQKNDLEERARQILFDDSKKKESSIIYKILSLLHIVNAQKSIDKIDLEINNKKVKYEQDTKKLDGLLITKKEELAKLENEITSLETSILDKLKKLEDGQIIGDGRSDFTKKSTTYNFTYNNQEFAFLDVPGIEGHEEIVIDEISLAVKKAHAVFYVTSSSTPPQKGDEHKKGTLEKIKEHLGSQTEVYTIFNKRVTNPMQLNKALVSDDEKDSLKIVDEKINNILKENYAGHKIVSAKIAFLAIAKCLVANSKIYNEKKKFLDKFSTNELIEKANFDELCNFISDELVINTKQKIKKSNYNKANEILNELIDILDKALKNNFEPLYKQLVQEVDNASNNLKNTLRKSKIDLDSVIAKALRDFENDTRKEIYRYIDKNISDDSFKSKLENLLENNSEKMVEAIPKNIEIQMFKFQSSIIESLENFKRRVDLAIQDYQTLDFGSLDSEFKINLQIDNGIDKMALAGSLVGAGGLAYSAIMFSNSWNPVGWTMFAIGAVTVLIGVYKSFRKWLSDDYKKSEQRKSADENIENIIDRMKPEMIKNMEPIFDDTTKLIDNIVDDLKIIVTQRKIAQEHLKNAHQMLVQIAKQIKIEGEK
jgi:hypothetical protein